MDPLYWSILLLALGVALIVLELFVPSGGILGFLALVSLLAAIWVGYMGSPALGTIVLLITLIVVPVVVGVGLKIWPHTPFGRLILGRGPESPDDVLPETEEYRGGCPPEESTIARTSYLLQCEAVSELVARRCIPR